VIFKKTQKTPQLANNSQLLPALIFAFILTITTPQHTFANDEKGPILIELFTSKGCPACPPADKNLSQLTQNPKIIGISCHVTYFDRGSRKDKFSKPFCDARQNIYKLALKTGGIFTPMMIINGKTLTTGVKPQHTQNIINQAYKGKNYPVGLFKNDQYLDIQLPTITLQSDADIWLFEIQKSAQHPGYTQYRNIVTNITKLLRWDGKSTNMAFPVPPVQDSDPNTAFVIVAQTYKNGVIAIGHTGF